MLNNYVQLIKTLKVNQDALLERIEQLESQVETIANDLYYLREMLSDDGK